MNIAQIARQRLSNQGLLTAPFAAAEDVVAWLGAVQSQEYGLAKAAVAQRCTGITEADVDRAVADGVILRTHVLRPTWHFVQRDDIRWLLDLTAPRVQAMTEHRHRQLGIDGTFLARGIATIAAALADHTHLTRRELAAVLQRAGIRTDGQILPHLLMAAELRAVICSGAPCGRHQTFALLHERAPDAAWLPRDEALGELAARYFRSHGPATRRDLQWWSSLTAADVRRGIEIAGAELESFDTGGRTYWHDPSLPPARKAARAEHRVHQFDEYLVGYTESRGIADIAGMLPRGETLIRAVLRDGQVVGRWR